MDAAIPGWARDGAFSGLEKFSRGMTKPQLPGMVIQTTILVRKPEAPYV